MRLTQEAGMTSHLGAHVQVAFWLLPEATLSTCPESNSVPPSAPPSEVMPLIPDVSGNPGRPSPDLGLYEPTTKGKIIRG